MAQCAGRLFIRGLNDFMRFRAAPFLMCTFISLGAITCCKGCALVVSGVDVFVDGLLKDAGTKMNGLVTRNSSGHVRRMF